MCNEIKVNISNDKYIKLSEYLKTFPNYNGCFSEYDKNGNQLHPDTTPQKNKVGITDTILGIEFDTNIILINKNNQLDMIASIEKDNGNIEEYYIIQNIKSIKFISCKFNNDFMIKNNLDSLEFNNCIFEKRCYLNNQYEGNNSTININNIKIKKTIFNENFKLHNTIINSFYIVDTDFIKNADFFKSEFKNGFENKISFNAINFNELALFGDTKFYKFLKFKYVTFKGYTHFRSATFYEGLDLEYANVEKEMNFFNIHELSNTKSKKNTSQETYRIIKYQLQKVGNVIQSNKYQALELEKRKVNVCNKCSYKAFLDCIVLNVHSISSSYSTNWFFVLMWICIVGLLTTIGMTEGFNIYDTSTYYLIEKGKIFINMQLVHFGHDTFTFIIDYNDYKLNYDLSLENKIILFINKISLGYLYYQFLLSVRKDMRK